MKGLTITSYHEEMSEGIYLLIITSVFRFWRFWEKCRKGLRLKPDLLGALCPFDKLSTGFTHPTSFSLQKTLAVFIGTPPLAMIDRVTSNPADKGD